MIAAIISREVEKEVNVDAFRWGCSGRNELETKEERRKSENNHMAME